jgi:hypothetical protein
VKPLIALLAAAALTGCDTIPTEAPSVNIVSDNFCAVAKKVTWSVTDTWQTIDEARRHNARVDRLCGVPGDKGKPAPATS